MIENRRPSHRGATRPVAWIVLLMTGALLQACGQNGGNAGSGRRVYAADLAGAAKTCEVPTISPAGGKTTSAAIKLVNDGGWCGLPVRQDSSKPFDAGLLTARPAHGTVLIHEVGDETRIDYTPDRGFSGTDGFSVRLVPGDGTIRIAVAVAAPEK
jgi:hypothetical protein